MNISLVKICEEISSSTIGILFTLLPLQNVFVGNKQTFSCKLTLINSLGPLHDSKSRLCNIHA